MNAESIAPATTAERTIRVTATDEKSLLAAVLRHLFYAKGDISPEPGAQSIQSPEGEVIGFRADGHDVAGLLDAAIAAALDEADSQNVFVLDVEIGGVLSTPDGIRCWGYLTTTPRTVSPASTFVVTSSTLIAADERLCAEVVFAIGTA